MIMTVLNTMFQEAAISNSSSWTEKVQARMQGYRCCEVGESLAGTVAARVKFDGLCGCWYQTCGLSFPLTTPVITGAAYQLSFLCTVAVSIWQRGLFE